MSKEEILELIKLLSALESWCFSLRERIPDQLLERIDSSMSRLSEEVLK